MVSRRRFLVMVGGAAAVAGAVVVGVNALPGGAPAGGPPAIRYGQERCAYCGMTIGDARFAAAWRSAEGAAQRFDDIGCMVNAMRTRNPGAGTSYYVHDYTDESWLEAPSARYVISPAIRTPMAYGVAALSKSGSASVPGAADRPVLGWDALLDQVERKGN